jgi:hypothetical protein
LIDHDDVFEVQTRGDVQRRLAGRVGLRVEAAALTEVQDDAAASRLTINDRARPVTLDKASGIASFMRSWTMHQSLDAWNTVLRDWCMRAPRAPSTARSI